MSQVIVDTEEAADQDNERMLALLGVTREQVLAELAYRQRKKHALAVRRMAAAARAGGERRAIKGADVGGFCEMMIDPISYHYWGQRLGYKCWEDDQFRREYLRDNAASRVKTTSSATMSLAGVSFLNRKKVKAAAKAPTASNVVQTLARGRGRWAA